jgi:2'-5' RNA ligase
VHSVEVVLDDAAEAVIRSQWAALLAAGLPSQARHTGASNRPHITVALAGSLSREAAAALQGVTARLPLPITIGGLVVFGSDRFVLARLAVPSAALLELQASVRSALVDEVDPHGHFAPGRWTPHVTLGRRLTAAQVGAALLVLGESSALGGQLVAARCWDMAAKQETWLEPGR